MEANILIIEDDIRISELLQRGLQENGYMVDVVYDGKTAQNIIYKKKYDLIITDIILPEIDGLKLSKEIRKINPDIPIIMLTALGTTDDKLEGFDAGADDYLVKPFEMRELLARIKVLLKRNSKDKTQNNILTYSDLEMNLHTKIVKRKGVEINLTPKEFNLLKYMLENAERVLSRNEIAEKVWNTYFDTGTNFIDVYINYLRKKIDKNFETKLIHTKSGMGFILKHEQ